VHQFDKVEMFSFTAPEQAAEEHRFILSQQEAILEDLGLHWRVVDIALGDLGAPAARKFDCEAWMPGQERFREVTSCSNCTDYQARRLKARTRGDSGTEMVYTLNGTAVAVGRTLIALLETHQRADGAVSSEGAPPSCRTMAPPQSCPQTEDFGPSRLRLSLFVGVGGRYALAARAITPFGGSSLPQSRRR